jgi:hypothetical protein
VNVLAVSGYQAVGVAVGFLLLAGWVIFVVVNAGRASRPPGSEIEDAPNRRVYLSDDELETKKLDRTLSYGLLALAFIAIALPVYWLREPTRQTNATNGFDKR